MFKRIFLFLWIVQLLVLAPLNAIIVAQGKSSQAIFLGMNIVFGALAWFMWRDAAERESWSKL